MAAAWNHGHVSLLLLIMVSTTCLADFTNEKKVNDDYFLRWTYNEAEETVTFQVTARTTGYIGLGLSPTGSMIHADIFIGWVKNGKGFIKDCHGKDTNTLPLVDATNNLELIAAHENETFTTITFKRKTITCDKDDLDITKDSQKMIYAYHDVEPDGEDLSPSMYHRANRGAWSTHLLTPVGSSNQLPDDIITMDFRMANITVPDAKTTYWCRAFQVNLTQSLGRPGKHHVIKTAAEIRRDAEWNNLPYVHHMLLFRCVYFPDGWQNSGILEAGIECNSVEGGSGDNFAARCGSADVVASWAVGGSDFNFPENTGLPLGDNEEEVFMIQMHYDNPTQDAGVIDDSGVRLYLTPTLRQHDSGILSVVTAVLNWHVIPPQQESFTSVGICHPNCTKANFPESGVTAYAALLHTHLLGRKVRLRHYRDGKELPILFADEHYNFDYQEMQARDTTVQILPGDELVTECVYNSMQRNASTFAGLGTQQEMCFTFLVYYPKVNMTFCQSIPPTAEYVGKIVGFDPLPFFQNNPQSWWGYEGWKKYMKNLVWNDTMGKEFEKAGLEDPRLFQCQLSDGSFNPPFAQGPVPVITERLHAKQDPCKVVMTTTSKPDGGNAAVTSTSPMGRLYILTTATICVLLATM